MNISKMFQMQKDFDNTVAVPEGVSAKRVDKKKRIALLVEIGELANEIRTFKFWSQDRETRRKEALEEWADCMHFLLSIGLTLGVSQEHSGVVLKRIGVMFTNNQSAPPEVQEVIVEDLLEGVFLGAALLLEISEEDQHKQWGVLFSSLCALGLMLGFTYEELQVAFDAKNDKNHDRQARGY